MYKPLTRSLCKKQNLLPKNTASEFSLMFAKAALTSPGFQVWLLFGGPETFGTMDSNTGKTLSVLLLSGRKLASLSAAHMTILARNIETKAPENKHSLCCQFACGGDNLEKV